MQKIEEKQQIRTNATNESAGEVHSKNYVKGSTEKVDPDKLSQQKNPTKTTQQPTTTEKVAETGPLNIPGNKENVYNMEEEVVNTKTEKQENNVVQQEKTFISNHTP